MIDTNLVKYFWRCGDNEIIEFAMLRARLNKEEKDVLVAVLDNCHTQEKTAEILGFSVRKVQNVWYSAAYKLLRIDWVSAYAKELRVKNDDG